MVMSFLSLASLILIQNPGNYPVDEVNLRQTFSKAQAHFEKEIGPLTSPVTVSISTDDCLRTGYNRRKKEVVFCPNGNVTDAGLQSVDVINHELFHAFLCQYDTNTCVSDEYDYLHEALADTFAYQLKPDEYFGENFYKAHPYIRTYHSTWRVGLVKTEHEKGTALASVFIREKRPLKHLLELFRSESPKEEVDVLVEGRAVSKLNRYRLKADEVLKLSFQFTPESGAAAVKWLTPQGISIEGRAPFHYEISVNPTLKQSKALAIFLSENGVELGRQAFYFGTEL